MKPNPHKPGAASALSFSRPDRNRADLHVHTTHSDGVCSPCEVIVAAARVGLSALAVTDHDTVSALAVAQPEASRWKIELIKGIELTCSQDNREIHILGYFIRDDDQALDHALKSLRTGRALRMEVMSERLRTLGFSVDLNALRNVFPHSNLGRRHLADYLVRTHQVINMREVFSRFLADGRPACVDKPRLQSEDAIKLIRGAGGVAALAHPPHDLPRSSLQSLVEEGLQAIEVDGPGFSRSKSQRIGDWANRLGLIRVAGSDFHAADRPGRWVGAITTAQEELERLRKASRCDATNKSASNKLGYG